MKRFELNNLGPEWVWEADDENHASKIYINVILNGSEDDRGATMKEWEDHCKDIGIDGKLEWNEV